jgi:hypothetical protein
MDSKIIKIKLAALLNPNLTITGLMADRCQNLVDDIDLA